MFPPLPKSTHTPHQVVPIIRANHPSLSCHPRSRRGPSRVPVPTSRVGGVRRGIFLFFLLPVDKSRVGVLEDAALASFASRAGWLSHRFAAPGPILSVSLIQSQPAALLVPPAGRIPRHNGLSANFAGTVWNVQTTASPPSQLGLAQASGDGSGGFWAKRWRRPSRDPGPGWLAWLRYGYGIACDEESSTSRTIAACGG